MAEPRVTGDDRLESRNPSTAPEVEDAGHSDAQTTANQPRAGHIVAECFDSAEAFPDALSPRGYRWQKHHGGKAGSNRFVLPPGRWLFRGHADSRWKLLPVALRSDTNLDPWAKPRWGTPTSNLAQIFYEQTLLTYYLREADDQGLAVPFDFSQGTIELRESIAWPPARVVPALALLQHYGVPTRLLDWTNRRYTAAYFAAREAAEW